MVCYAYFANEKIHEDIYLPQIAEAENNPELYEKLLEEYQRKVDADFVKIEVPFKIIINSLWEILAPHEKKRFENFLLPSFEFQKRKIGDAIITR